MMENLRNKIETLLKEKKEELPEYPRNKFIEISKNLEDPATYESAITASRKITEWYLRELYAFYSGTESNRLGHMQSEVLLQTLSKAIPLERQGILRSLQSLQNYFSHAQADISGINSHTLQGVLLLVIGLMESVDSVLAAGNMSGKSNPKKPHPSQKPLVLGIDVGTSKIAAGIISFADIQRPKMLQKTRIFHREIESAVGILEKIEHIITLLADQCAIGIQDLTGIGIGLPGQVDYRTGLLKFAPGLKLRNINVSSLLTAKFGIPVFADNDVNCSTLAELNWGQGKNFSNFICVFVGTGIGGGFVFDKKLYRGASFSAGEIGHMKVNWSDDARVCTCGAKGCFEEYASARAIIRMAREAIFDARDRMTSSVLTEIDPQTIKPEDVVNAIKRQDPLGIQLAEKIAGALAVGVSNIANFLNPEAIVLGGGIINGFYDFDFFNGLFAAKFRELTLESCGNTSLLLSSFGDDNPLFGAASLVPLPFGGKKDSEYTEKSVQ